jgi:hypothetical protein
MVEKPEATLLQPENPISNFLYSNLPFSSGKWICNVLSSKDNDGAANQREKRRIEQT